MYAPVAFLNRVVVPSGQELWTPAQISTAAWYDSSDSSTITLSGSNVSQWNDKSGNGRHLGMGTAGNQPAYDTTGSFNGLNSVNFDGSTDYMTASVSFSIGWQICAVVPEGLQSYGSPLSYTTKHGLIREDTTLTQYTVGSHAWGSTISRVNSVLSTAMNVTASIYDNGGTPQSLTPQVGRDSNGGTYEVCQLGEIILLDQQPTTEIREKLEGYLAWKWGCIADFPAGFTYKNDPPYV